MYRPSLAFAGEALAAMKLYRESHRGQGRSYRDKVDKNRLRIND